jgi:hypothetical protein
VALFYAVENWRGSRAFARYKKSWEAKGENFDWHAVVPAPVSDERNLAASPLFKPLLDYERVNGKVEWRSSADDAKEFKMIEKGPHISGVDSPKLMDLVAWGSFLSGENPEGAAGKPGAQVLAGLKRFDRQFKELQEAIASRPESRWPVRYEDNFAALLPHLAVVKDITLACAIRAAAHLALGQTNEGFEDVKMALAVTESIKSDPLLLTHVVRMVMINACAQAVREGLARDSWTDEQLVYFEERFGNMNLLAEFKQCMRGERGFCLEAIEMSRTARLGPEFWVNPGSVAPIWAKRPIMRVVPTGWFYQNELGILKFHQEYSLATVDENAQRVYNQKIAAGERALTNSARPYNVLVHMLVPAVSSALSKSARGQTTVAQTSLACALERYHRVHKQYPDLLAQLHKQFIRYVPHDVMDGNEMRYRREGDHSYLLYSVGWNGSDDGGVVGKSGKSNGVDYNQGDWVWRKPQLKVGEESE